MNTDIQMHDVVALLGGVPAKHFDTVAAGCRYIVTHNLRHFRGTERWGVSAVPPSGFLKLIEKEI